MNKRGFYFFLFFLSLLVFTSGIVPSVSAQGPEADLSLTKTVDRKIVRIGQNITFTITVTNL